MAQGTGTVQEIIRMLQKSNISRPPLASLLAADPHRFEQFSCRIPGLLFDYSRTALNGNDFSGLLALAELSGVAAQRARLFAGEAINNTENRAVLHPVWRERNFRDVLPEAEAVECLSALERMREIATALHRGFLPGTGATDGDRIRHVIHVGIGGSLLGPRLLCQVFPGAEPSPRIHFISSVDAWERERLLASVDPRETAIILVSKSFTTSEVLAHARRLRQWQGSALGPHDSASRLFAITAAADKAKAFGVPSSQVLQMGEWTGGRYSLWSPVSLSAAISMGPHAFDRLCAGGAHMDRHFRDELPASNMPLIHGLLSCWHRNVCNYPCRGIVPYAGRLQGLPNWLQQVQMESNGKSVTRQGAPVEMDTSPMVFGDCGTDAQHALFQAFHQGTGIVPLDFIGVIRPDHADTAAQAELLSHLLAQASALAIGRDREHTSAQMAAEGKSPAQIEKLLPHRIMPGNRPSSLLMLDELTPENLGKLLVLYEHSVFVESVVWDINAFDQWGVELGKVMANSIEPALTCAGAPPRLQIAGLDGLVAHIRDVMEGVATSA